MAGPTWDAAKWLALVISLLGALALWMKWEIADVKQDVRLIAKDTLREAQRYADEGRQGRFTSDEFNLAISFRDQQIEKIEEEQHEILEDMARLRTLVSEYREWTRILGPRVNDAVADMSRLDGAFAAIGHQVSAALLDLQEVKEKQDQVRESLIPNVQTKIDQHTSTPHELLRMTPNAR